MPGAWWGITISRDRQGPYPICLSLCHPQERPSDLIRVLKTQTSKKVHQNKDYNQYIKQYLLGNVPLWSPSYFIATTGGATLEKVKEYVESQRTDDHKRKYQKQADIVSRGKSKSACNRRQLKLTAVFCLKLDNF